MWLLLSTFLLYLGCNASAEDELIQIPADFSLGASSAALQIEGAWNLSGKTESAWDKLSHEHPEKVYDGSNADISSDSYHKYKEDIRLLKELGLTHYRFSMSWNRILPTGFPNVINQEGVDYYHRVLDELERYNITPYVTLLHFDYPQAIQEYGGWTSDVIVDQFGDFARVMFREFGHRIKIWGTINEPTILCKYGYEVGWLAPGLSLGLPGYYLCIHNVLKAHARAYHIYDDEFRAKQNGLIGIVPHCSQYYAIDENDTESPELAWQYDCGIIGHPIFSETGDYHPEIKRRIAVNSKFEGLERSRLPSFSKYWINYIKGTSDFLGLNHYVKGFVEKAESNTTVYENEIGVTSTLVNTSNATPEAFLDLLIKIKTEYGDVPVYIMESGRYEKQMDDDLKMNYIYLYLKAVLTAKIEYSCNVKAFSVWSLIDSYEWFYGYSPKFGLVHVDFDSPNRTRTIRKSGQWYSSVAFSRQLLPVLP